MKKGITVITVFLSLLVVAGTVFADTEYDAALKDYAGRNYREAVIRLQAYVEKKPDPAAYYLLGYSLYELGRLNEAAANFDQAYLVDPSFSPEKLGLAKEFPKVSAKKAGKKPHGHKHAARGKQHTHSGKKSTAAAQASPEKCPAPSQKSGSGKTP
jgi:tetratricopeptide (TPR) repeat protein